VDNFERAQAYLRVVQALETRDEFTNEDRGSTLTAAAELHLRRGEYARAYDAYDRAVGVLDSGETSHSYHIGQARLGRAAALSELGRFEDAIADQRWALDRWTRELGPRHPFVASAMANLGISLLRLERIEEAIPLLRQAIEIHSEANGPHHRETGFLHDNLAYAYTLAKDFEKAEVEHDKAIAIISKALGPEHRHVAIARDNRALALRELGRYDEAETEHRRALAVFEKQLGVGHPDTERCRLLLAQLLTKQEKVDEAVALMESALSRLENEGDRRATAVARFQLGRLLLRMDRPRAVQLLETSWSVLRIDRNVPPTTRVAAGLALAQALWPSDPSRARSLALTLDSVVRAHPDLVLVRQRLHTWLESHGPGDEGSGDR
jgi:tetratricopeptide (TPR) repeat protein